MKGGVIMTPILDFLFEVVLSPQEKVDNVKSRVTQASTAYHTARNMYEGRATNLQDAFADASKRSKAYTESLFEGVKMPW